MIFLAFHKQHENATFPCAPDDKAPPSRLHRAKQIRTALLKAGKFPVYGTGTLPTDSAFRTEAFSVGESIEIGKVIIHDQDFIVADNDGQVVIPNETIREVLGKVIEIDAGDKDVWADALTRLAEFHDNSIDEIVARHGGHL